MNDRAFTLCTWAIGVLAVLMMLLALTGRP